MFKPCFAMSWCQKHNLYNRYGSVKGTVQSSANIDGYSKPLQKPEDLKVQEEECKLGEKQR